MHKINTMKSKFRNTVLKLLIPLLAIAVCGNADARKMKWEKKGNEAVIVYYDDNGKKIVGTGFDPKYKHPGPFKNGFIWDDYITVANFTWAKDANPAAKHPIHLVKIQFGEVVDCNFDGLNAYDDVYYMFDDRGQRPTGECGGVYYEVCRDGKRGVVTIDGRPREIIPTAYNHVLPILYIPTRYSERYYRERTGEKIAWIAIGDGKNTVYDMNGNILISPTERDLYAGTFFVKEGYKLKHDYKAHFMDCYGKMKDYPAYILTPFTGVLATAPAGKGAGGALMDDRDRSSNFKHLRQPVFFLDSDKDVSIFMAGPRNASVNIPHIRFLTEYKEGADLPNFRFGEDSDGSYFAIAPDKYGRERDKAGFVDFGEDLTYIPPVFHADWTVATVRPERFLSVPSDPAQVYFVRKEIDNRNGMINRLYSIPAQKFIWNTQDYAIRSSKGEYGGFIDIVPSCKSDSVIKGFITARADSVVILGNEEKLANMGKDKAIVGDNRIFTFGGGTGLANDSASRYIAPVYDDIESLRNVSPAAPEDWFTSRRGDRYGLICQGVTIMDCVFDKVAAEGDSAVTFTLNSWPRKGYKGIDGRLNTSEAPIVPYTITFRMDSLGIVNDNSQKLFDRLFLIDNEDALKDMYYSLFDMISFSSKTELFYPLSLYCAMATEELLIKAISTDAGSAPAITNRGAEFARRLYDMIGLKEEAKRCSSLGEELNNVRREQAERLRLQYEQQQEAIRNQRAQAWAQLADALGQMAQGINSAVSQYQNTKRANVSRGTATVRNSSSASSSSVSSGKSTRSPGHTNSAPKRYEWMSLASTYRDWRSTIIKMQVWPEKYNESDLRYAQQKMREIRKEIEKRGGTQPKDDLEDWHP